MTCSGYVDEPAERPAAGPSRSPLFASIAHLLPNVEPSNTEAQLAGRQQVCPADPVRDTWLGDSDEVYALLLI